MSHASPSDPETLASAAAGPPLTPGQRAIGDRVRERVRRREPIRQVLEFLVTELAREFPSHSWTGVYLSEGDALTLGPFRGPDTPHKRIRIGEHGICGWVAKHAKPQVIPDVSVDPRYLACSPTVRSEIVVPIRRGAEVLGVLDIDSEIPAAFTRTDLAALVELAEIVAPAFPKTAPGPAAR